MEGRLNRTPWLALWALALAACSGACASTGAVPRPFPMPGGSARGPASPAPLPPDVATPDPSAPAGPSTPATPPATRASRGSTTPARPGHVDAYALVGTALALRGIPYRNGGTDPSGFDCSGFTQYVFSQYGVLLPREVRDQYRMGKSVKPEELEPGDIVFFSTTEPGPSHVAIAIGGDGFVHAPSSTGVVRVEHLNSSYWGPRFLAARRLGN